MSKVVIFPFGMVMAVVFLFMLISARSELDKVENDYLDLSQQFTQLNRDLALQYVNDFVDKEQDDKLITEIIDQLSPLLMVSLPDNKIVPYSTPVEYEDYVKGYISGWKFILLEIHTLDHELLNFLGCNIRIGIADSAEKGTIFGGFTHSFSFPPYKYQIDSKAYTKGREEGIKQAETIYNKNIDNCGLVRSKYFDYDLGRAERFELVDESYIQNRLAEVPSFKSLIIVKKILEKID
jgi:hypothetical protein